MNWLRSQYGNNYKCILGNGLVINVTQSLTKSDTYHAYVFGNEVGTCNNVEDAKELCELGAKGIIRRVYEKYYKEKD